MSDVMRWRYGETNPVTAAVDADVEIHIGDLVYLENGIAKPASAHEVFPDTEETIELFRDKFLGVAMQSSRLGQVAPIRVATTGVFEFHCRSARYILGDFIGVKFVDGFSDQEVGFVPGAYLAIGRVTKNAENATSVLVNIVSTVMHGGVYDTRPVRAGR